MAAVKVRINRAPVLTLWCVVVARRLGYKEDEALTLARALTGSTAQAHGQALGIYTAMCRGVCDTPSKQKGDKQSKEKKPPQVFTARYRGICDTQQFLAKKIPVVRTREGIRAVSGGRPIEPEQVRRYLASKFGAALPDARDAMERLAKSLSPSELNAKAYSLYGKFTPQVPSGTAGWGAQGELNRLPTKPSDAERRRSQILPQTPRDLGGARSPAGCRAASGDVEIRIA